MKNCGGELAGYVLSPRVEHPIDPSRLGVASHVTLGGFAHLPNMAAGSVQALRPRRIH